MLDFYTLDVFTQTAFTGNGLAVVMGAAALNTVQMQTLAREFNLSETVFVLPPTQPDVIARLRIFTPAQELPFAGHPTIGAACLLSELGLAPRPMPDGGVTYLLEESAGLVPVSVHHSHHGWSAELTVPRPPEFRSFDADPDALAAALALPINAWASPPLQASCGTPFVIAQLRQPELLASIDCNLSALTALLQPLWGHALYIYACGYSGEIRARMFAPGLGLGEDPATGSAAATLACVLAQAATDADGEFHWDIHQGIEMGRPSLLRTSVRKRAGQIVLAQVGGFAVRVASGTICVP